jgi:hypothetical protein
MLHAGLEFLVALECAVCGQIVDADAVSALSLRTFLFRLKLEKFAVCPCCTQDVSFEKQSDIDYQRRWTPFVASLIAEYKRGVRWYRFRRTSMPG